jgi:hypothetical protein
VTALIEEMKIVVRGIWQSIGFGASANTAATVVPVLVVGIALNLIALRAMDRIHPNGETAQIVGIARAELNCVRNATASMSPQIGEYERGRCSVKRWASSRLAELAELVHRRIATGSDRLDEGTRRLTVRRCGDLSVFAKHAKALQAI